MIKTKVCVDCGQKLSIYKFEVDKIDYDKDVTYYRPRCRDCQKLYKAKQKRLGRSKTRVEDKIILSISETAQYLGFKESVVKRWIENKYIPYVLIEDEIYFNKLSLNQWLKDLEQKNDDGC